MRASDEELFHISRKEYDIINSLDHENIIKAEGFYTNTLRKEAYLVMEYIGAGCDLKKFVKKYKQEKYELSEYRK